MRRRDKQQIHMETEQDNGLIPWRRW